MWNDSIIRTQIVKVDCRLAVPCQEEGCEGIHRQISAEVVWIA